MENQQPPEPKNKIKRVIPYLLLGIFALVALVSLYLAYQANIKTKTTPPDYKKVSAVIGTDIPVSIKSDRTAMFFEHNGQLLSLNNKITDLMVDTEYTFILRNDSGVKQGVFIPALKENVVVETAQTVSISIRFDNPGTYYFMGNVYQPGWDGLKSGFEVGMDTIEPPPITASAGTATPTPTPTSSMGTCQCDLSVVMEDNCVAPAVPVCQSQMVCVCNAFAGAKPTSTVTPTPTMTSTPTVSPTPTTGAGGAFTSCADVTEIPQAECQALVDLYNSTNGPGWTPHPGWLQTITPCGWYGVECNAPSGTLRHIIRINLQQSNLTGQIPESFGNLTQLQSLILYANSITGNIPTSISNLTNLTYLALNSNLLSGNIPQNIGNLTSLNALYLDANQLTGPIPDSIGNIPLTVLNLKFNRLNGNIPTTLSNLANLRQLGLDYNQFTGNIPSVLGQLTRLTTLHLANNQLTGSVPASLANLTAIGGMNVSLATNSLTGVENQTVCPWLTAHSASNWWQTQTPPIATDPCAGTSGIGLEEAQPVRARTNTSTSPMPVVTSPNILEQVVIFFQQLLQNVFGKK